MKRGSTTMGSLRVVAVALLCVAVAAAVQFGPYFVKMMKLYQEGPSVGAALNSPAVQVDRKLRGTTYNFLYEDRDEAGTLPLRVEQRREHPAGHHLRVPLVRQLGLPRVLPRRLELRLLEPGGVGSCLQRLGVGPGVRHPDTLTGGPGP